MTDLNHVVVIGRMTRDLDETSFGYINTGTARLNVSIAVNRAVKRGEEWTDEVSYFDVTYWGKPAETIKPYLGKGKQIAVDGYLKQDRWEKDGQKHSKISIVANSIQLLGGKTDNGNGGNTTPQYTGGTFKPVNNQPAQAETYTGGPGDGFPEDIPF